MRNGVVDQGLARLADSLRRSVLDEIARHRIRLDDPRHELRQLQETVEDAASHELPTRSESCELEPAATADPARTGQDVRVTKTPSLG